MRKLSLKSFILVVGVFASAMASANLIVNGGFEETDVKENRWAWFSSDKVNGWDGSNIEIWNSFRNVTAFEGTQHAELNAHPSNGDAFSIFQNFETQVGGVYNVSFAYSARRHDKEAFMLELGATGDKQIFSSLIDDHTVGKWNVFSSSFVAQSKVTNIKFTSVTPYSGTVGNFLDDIVVEQASTSFKSNQVSEPAGALLLGLGLLVVMRKRKAAQNTQ